jgi:hypothetical protein
VDKLVVREPPHDGLFGRPGVAKAAGWAASHDLAAVKRLARSAEATVNDVMMAAVAGALRRYLLGQGLPAADVVTAIPVNLRRPDEPLHPHLGNRFALAAVDLPVGTPTPLRRVAVAKARMDELKASPEVLLTSNMTTAIGGMGWVSDRASRRAAAYFAGKVVGVTTNVPGPTAARSLAGHRVAGMLGWVPGAHEQCVGTSIVSYDGRVRVGFKVDATQVDLAALVQCYTEEIGSLLGPIP